MEPSKRGVSPKEESWIRYTCVSLLHPRFFNLAPALYLLEHAEFVTAFCFIIILRNLYAPHFVFCIKDWELPKL